LIGREFASTGLAIHLVLEKSKKLSEGNGDLTVDFFDGNDDFRHFFSSPDAASGSGFPGSGHYRCASNPPSRTVALSSSPHVFQDENPHGFGGLLGQPDAARACRVMSSA